MFPRWIVSECYILISFDAEEGQPRLEKMLLRLLPNLFSIKKITSKNILLTLKDVKDLSIFRASFPAVKIDNGYIHSALEIPCDNSLFYPFLDLVEKGCETQLFKVAKNHPQVYDETYDLICSLDRDTLETIHFYIENDCSPLLASYALFIHKNTVTYRVNMFVKKTGISLELFSNQMFVYQLLASHANEDGEEM